VLRELAEQLPIEQDFASAMYRKVTAFIGPTGVGKTTTLAKVAATLVLKYSQRICLITADNFRIAAVEQLKTYADIVNLPLFVTTNPDELKHLLDDIRSNYDYILLDTTGRSPYDNSKLNDVAACLSVSPDIVPVVVMSMAGNHAELGDMFERYMGLEPAYVVFTKLDETRFYGPLANIPIKKKVPLLLLSTGQGVPDDLEVPDGKKIAKKLLQEIPELWKEN
jgi:flagellar biosynthesis protein FlhF